VLVWGSTGGGLCSCECWTRWARARVSALLGPSEGSAWWARAQVVQCTWGILPVVLVLCTAPVNRREAGLVCVRVFGECVCVCALPQTTPSYYTPGGHTGMLMVERTKGACFHTVLRMRPDAMACWARGRSGLAGPE